MSKCKHKNAYYFHNNAPAYCPDCKTYPETIRENAKKGDKKDEKQKH